MTHRTYRHIARRIGQAAASGSIAGLLATRAGHAQVPPPPEGALPPYRPPAIALVQPGVSATVPEDKPIVVFRYVQGEPDDAVDLRSLRVLVDGADRSELFEAQDGKAWGPLAPTIPVPARSYAVVARLCSMRGACASTTATIIAVAADGEPTETGSRRDTLLDALLQALRALLRA